MKKCRVFAILLALLLPVLCVTAMADAPSDGAYTCAVTLTGGTGRATVQSPAELQVENGVITATVVWSSKNYDFMEVDGQRYFPVQTEGNSTFEIPVVLDEDMPVAAETLAMSQPHVIEYTLHFDGSTLKSADASGPSGALWAAVVVVAGAVIAWRVARLRKGRAA